MENSSRLPEWVEKWLKLPFHDGKKCTRHGRYKTVYCTACMEDPICDKCSINSKKHTRDHQTLKVRRASKRVAIEIKVIRRFLDISEIQEYSINSKDIVFLNPNLESTNAKRIPFDHTCQSKFIKSSSPYQFCSIACKVAKEGCGMVVEKKCDESWGGLSFDTYDDFSADDDEVTGGRMVTTIKEKLTSSDQHQRSSNSSFSFRKRSRKGTPRRAPFM